MMSFIYIRSLFHAPSLAHKVTPQQATGNCKLKSGPITFEKRTKCNKGDVTLIWLTVVKQKTVSLPLF